MCFRSREAAGAGPKHEPAVTTGWGAVPSIATLAEAGLTGEPPLLHPQLCLLQPPPA